jgi:hypothetical protein
MNSDRNRELILLLEERNKSDWQRRKQRFLAAEARLFGVDEKTGSPILNGLTALLEKSRRDEPLSWDEQVVLALGCLPKSDRMRRDA